MNKLITLLITMMLVLSLAGCGDTEAPADVADPGSSQQEPSNPPDDSTSPDGVDVSTLNGFLKQFGLTEDDIKPSEYFSSFEYTVTEDKSYQGVVKVNMEWSGGADQKAAMSDLIHQIFDRTVAVSDDGKAYKPYTTDEYILEDGEINDAQWAWLFNETSYWVTIYPDGALEYLEISFN